MTRTDSSGEPASTSVWLGLARCRSTTRALAYMAQCISIAKPKYTHSGMKTPHHEREERWSSCSRAGGGGGQTGEGRGERVRVCGSGASASSRPMRSLSKKVLRM